ncbi:hypothetical protein OAP18_03200 [Gammaproteobacteria bacterium]|nr:hypothetical protein [Gammaproteobacteria bacterium]
MKYKGLLTLLLAFTVLQGCIDIDRAVMHPDPQFGEPTMGQELMDLDKARVSGAITGAEYDRLKARIINGAG